MWGKSRQTLYTDMKAGRLSVGRDERDAVYVDAAEMVRAYGEPPPRRDGPADETGQPPDAAPETALRRRAPASRGRGGAAARAGGDAPDGAGPGAPGQGATGRD